MESFALTPLWPHVAADVRIDHVSIDTREPFGNNTFFFALPGKKESGERYVQEAARKGAKGACVPLSFPKVDLPTPFVLIRASSPLDEMQKLAALYRKSLEVDIVAILGTHGKTFAKELMQTVFKDRKDFFFSEGSLNSQIGVPLAIFSLAKHHKKAAFEVAFTKAGELQRQFSWLDPHAAIVTQVKSKEIGLLSDPSRFWSELESLELKSWSLLPEERFPFSSVETIVFKKPLAGQPFIFQNEREFHLELPSGKKLSKSFPTSFPYLSDHLQVSFRASHLMGATEKELATAFLNYAPSLNRKEIWKTQSGVQVIHDATFSGSPALRESLKLLSLFPLSKKKYGFFSVAPEALDPDIASYFDEVHFEHEIAFESFASRLNPGDLLFYSGHEKKSIDDIARIIDGAPYSSYVTINLAHLKENIDYYRRILPAKTGVMGVLKAFGYGTDPLSPLCFLKLLGVDHFLLAHVEEGAFLRKAGIESHLFVLHANPWEYPKAIQAGLEVGVSSLEEIVQLERAALEASKTLSVHLHIDTGMKRLGCRSEDALFLAQKIALSPSLKLQGAFTHLAAAENPAFDAFTLEQIEIFQKAVDEIQNQGIDIPYRHAANSSGALRFAIPGCNLARIGLGIWGLTGSSAVKQDHPLKPTPSLFSRIAFIQECRKGETVSYGRTYTVGRKVEKIAVLPIGYFDGLKANVRAGASVCIRGKKAPMTGKICMDFMMVDITEIPEAEVGDTALIFGEDAFGNRMPLEEVAERGASHATEFFSTLGPRLPRIFLYDESP